MITFPFAFDVSLYGTDYSFFGLCTAIEDNYASSIIDVYFVDLVIVDVDGNDVYRKCRGEDGSPFHEAVAKHYLIKEYYGS